MHIGKFSRTWMKSTYSQTAEAMIASLAPSVLKSLILVALNPSARIKAAEKRAGFWRGQIFHLSKLNATSSRSQKMTCTGCRLQMSLVQHLTSNPCQAIVMQSRMPIHTQHTKSYRSLVKDSDLLKEVKDSEPFRRTVFSFYFKNQETSWLEYTRSVL